MLTGTKRNDSGTPLWAVLVEQHSKVGNTLLNSFTCNVRATTREEARQKALDEIEYYSKLQTIHVDTQEFMKLQRRPWMRQTLTGVRNIIISVKRVRE
jgi:hypothetical protein